MKYVGAVLVLVVPSVFALVALSAPPDNAAKPKPVEGDMHEFMEYVFEPTYQRLKQSIAKEPDAAGWKALKSDALILAEGANLLLFRTPAEDGNAWNENSASVRDLGGKLYAAAKKKDFKAARSEYESMLVNCNRCHTKFAKGEHQLEP